MYKKLVATGTLGFAVAVAGSALAAAPAYAAAYGGDHGHHGKHGHHGHHGKHHKDGAFSGNHTGGNFSILGGNQVIAPVSTAVNVCGNSLAILGISSASCKGGANIDY